MILHGEIHARSVNPGVHASLHPNCYHQIIHSNFNLNHFYQKLIRDYSKNIQKALDSVNWKSLFKSKIKMHSTKNIFRMLGLKVTSFISKI